MEGAGPAPTKPRRNAARRSSRRPWTISTRAASPRRAWTTSRPRPASRRARYIYFESKEDLLNGIVDAVALPNVARLERIATAPSAIEALSALMRFAPVLIDQTPLPKVAKVMIADSGAFPDVVRRYRQQAIDRVFQAIAAVLARGHETDEIHAPDPHLKARLVVAPILLSVIWRTVFEPAGVAPVDLGALFAEHEAMLLRALGAREAAP